MKNAVLIGMIGILLGSPLDSHADPPEIEEVHAGPERSFESIMRSVVEVRSFYGYGTGTVFEKSGKTYVLTAAHVVTGVDNEPIAVFVVHGEEQKPATIAYIDSGSDIAILAIDEMETRDPYRLKFRRSEIGVGDRAGYCGFPNRRDLACFSGGISHTSDGVINLHSYAFGGASGSLVVDSRGKAIGILSAIEVARFYGMPTPLESIVWIRPLSRDILENL